MRTPGLHAVRAFGILLILCAGALGAHAQFTVMPRILGNAAESPYSFVRVVVENRLDRDVRTGMRAIHHFSSAQQVTEIAARVFPAGSVTELDLPLLSKSYVQIQWRDPLSGNLQNQVAGGSGERVILHVSGPQAQLTQAQIDEYAKRLGMMPGMETVTQIPPDELPADWRCYLPFRSVMLPESAYQQLAPEARAGLDEWVHTGGDLTIYAAEQPGQQAHLLGRVTRMRENPLLLGVVLPEWMSPSKNWKDTLTQFWGEPPFDVDTAGGKTSGLVLASLFFLVAGPLNLFWVARRKRPHLLLKTVPALSVGFCLLIVLSFILTEGFARKGGTLSVALYDESSARGVMLDRHVLVSGLYPADGFAFPSGSIFFTSVDMAEADLRMDFDGAFHLREGFFKPRVPFYYGTLMPFDTRERLVVDAAAAEVTNGFEGAISGGMLRRDGVLWRIPALQKGQAGKLEITHDDRDLPADGWDPAVHQNLLQLLSATSAQLISAQPERLSEGCYWVRFADGWGGSRAGLNIDGPNEVVLVGRLAGSTGPAAKPLPAFTPAPVATPEEPNRFHHMPGMTMPGMPGMPESITTPEPPIPPTQDLSTSMPMNISTIAPRAGREVADAARD